MNSRGCRSGLLCSGMPVSLFYPVQDFNSTGNGDTTESMVLQGMAKP